MLLHNAVRSDDKEKLLHLLTRGGSVNQQNDSGETPLHVAALVGNVELARILIDLGASVELETVGHETALRYAIRHQHRDLVALIIARGGFK